MDFTYTNMLAHLNVGSAHPGGLSATKKAWQKMKHFPFQRILDAGCGTGQTLKFLADVSDCHLIGVDQNAIMLEQAKKRLQNKPVELLLADLKTLPFADDSIDCIFSESVSSFSETNSLLAEFYRVLRPDGLLHLIEITSSDLLTDSERTSINSFYGTEEILTKTEWYDQINSHHFDIIDTTILPATTAGEVDLDLTSGIDQIHLDFLTQHFQTIEQLKDKLVGLQIICQKKSSEDIDHASPGD